VISTVTCNNLRVWSAEVTSNWEGEIPDVVWVVAVSRSAARRPAELGEAVRQVRSERASPAH
jgi:hypothetical protein